MARTTNLRSLRFLKKRHSMETLYRQTSKKWQLTIQDKGNVKLILKKDDVGPMKLRYRSLNCLLTKFSEGQALFHQGSKKTTEIKISAKK